MKVEIIEKQMIKPSRPTPNNLRHYKLSLLDQLAVKFYVPAVLFYRTTTTIFPSDTFSVQLKRSLSETLSHLYPLAGRVTDVFTLDCDDSGAEYVHARAAGEMEMSAVVGCPRMETLVELLPCDPRKWPSEENEYSLLAVQVTEFACGGIAVGVCVWHGVADASTAATFLKTWATINREGDDNKIGEGFVHNCSGQFPPRHVDMIQTVPLPWDGEAETKGKPVTKRFVFDGSKISTLRRKLATCPTNIPTRIEALSAVMWTSYVAATLERNRDIKQHLVLCAVNLRKRVVPPLPPNSIGSSVHVALAKWEAEEERGPSVDECRRKVQRMIQDVKESLLRAVYGGPVEGPPRSLGEAMVMGCKEKVIISDEEEVGCLATTSWCRFPFYETDFGWGKPVWVANAFVGMNTVVFVDAPDGSGVEAWVKLREEDMSRLEKNQDFANLISISQIV